MLGVTVSLLFVVAWQFVSIISRFLNFSIRLVYVYSCPINSAQLTLFVPAILHHHECFSLYVTIKARRMFVNGAKSKAETLTFRLTTLLSLVPKKDLFLFTTARAELIIDLCNVNGSTGLLKCFFFKKHLSFYTIDFYRLLCRASLIYFLLW